MDERRRKQTPSFMVWLDSTSKLITVLTAILTPAVGAIVLGVNLIRDVADVKRDLGRVQAVVDQLAKKEGIYAKEEISQAGTQISNPLVQRNSGLPLPLGGDLWFGLPAAPVVKVDRRYLGLRELYPALLNLDPVGAYTDRRPGAR